VAALNLLINGLQSTIRKEERLQQQLIEKSETLIKSLEEIKIKNLELEQFGYVAAHDFKTPIRGINMLTEWLADEYRNKLDEKGVEYLDLLRNRVTRLEGVVDGVLAYSNIGKVKLQKVIVDLPQVLEDVVADLEVDADTKIIFDHLLPNILFVRNDSYRIFYNLLENAIVHNDKKVKWIHVGYKEFPNEWHFYVHDNGPGIARQYHHKIFHIFQTLEADDDKKRTGLGLSITQKILREAGEKIWVESEPGKGSTFWFTIKK
jgi:light-regulated signal transduction histidine kinase (bacteriophytochrome)